MSILRTLASTSARSLVAARSIHTSPVARRTVTEAVKETVQKVCLSDLCSPWQALICSLQVNIGVGQTLAKGIEKGEEATAATQETVGMSHIVSFGIHSSESRIARREDTGG